MRISSQQIFESGVRSMAQHTSDVMTSQEQISSGKKYQRASDSALSAGLGVQVTLDKAKYAMFKVNQDYANQSLSTADSQLLNLQNMMASFQRIMVQAGNDALGSDNRKLLGQQAKGLVDAMAQLANATDANGQKVFEKVAATQIVAIELAEGVTVKPRLTYGECLTLETSFSKVAGGTTTDAIAALQDMTEQLLQGNALRSGDYSTVDQALKTVVSAQVRTGVLQNQVDAATQAAEDQKLNIETERSALLDTDLAEATASLARSNALLQAAQAIISKLDTNTLFQKI
jgi:flagellin-like hook-associated protein FlgL